MSMVSAVAEPAGSVTGDLDDRRSGGGLVDQALVLCEGGDKCMHSEVVDGSGDAPAGLMDQGDGVVAEERIRSSGKADVLLDVAAVSARPIPPGGTGGRSVDPGLPRC